MSMAAILGAITAIAGLGVAFFKYFQKTPEQIERDRLAKNEAEGKKMIDEINNAIKKAKNENDTSDLEHIINRD